MKPVLCSQNLSEQIRLFFKHDYHSVCPGWTGAYFRCTLSSWASRTCQFSSSEGIHGYASEWSEQHTKTYKTREVFSYTSRFRVAFLITAKRFFQTAWMRCYDFATTTALANIAWNWASLAESNAGKPYLLSFLSVLMWNIWNAHQLYSSFRDQIITFLCDVVHKRSLNSSAAVWSYQYPFGEEIYGALNYSCNL